MTSSLASDPSILERLAELDPSDREAIVAEYARRWKLSVPSMKGLLSSDWQFVGRPKQQAPDWPWVFWFILAGRGFGKTKTGAEWVKQQIQTPTGDGRHRRIALVGPTLSDVRETMVEGESGLLSVLPASMLRGGSIDSGWNRSTVELFLENRVRIRGFSSEKPNRLRGPQFHDLWGDEISSWKDAKDGDKMDTTFSNAKLATRLGHRPQFCFTSTPKANKLTKALLALPRDQLALARGSSYENRANLSEVWWQTVVSPLEGTRTGRQEILAEVLDDIEGALWSSGQLDELRLRVDVHDLAKSLNRIVVGVDPNASQEEGSNAAGIVVAGADGKGLLDRKGYVLADRTVVRASPRAWAQAAVDAYYDFEADRIVAEKNMGGDMVEHTIKTVDPSVPVKLVNASRGKRTRAEPVAALYGEPNPDEGHEPKPGRVHHVGVFPLLEEELTTWTPEAESPDRLDACVWALSELMLGPSKTMTVHRPKGRIPTAAHG